MLRSRAIIRMGSAMACLLALAFAFALPALAKKDKRATSAVLPLTEPDEKPFGGTARFFRIQDVLDNAGGPAKDGRLASLGGTQSDAFALRGSITETGGEPFGLFAFRAPEGILWQKWRGVESDFTGELETLANCRISDGSCKPAARRLLALIDAAKALDGRARLDEVNRGVNGAIRYQTDMAQFGEADKWLSPLASFASGFGDCEDYAIAKYFVLREAGFPLANLRLVLVRDRAMRNDDHAILAARHEDRWLILDNRHNTLHDDMTLSHFTPLFAINHEGVKLVAAPYLKKTATASADTVPVAWLEGDEFALRGSIAVEPANGSSDFGVAPLLM
jgi:predicted transglutaminase-like cysteine proteinase